MPDSQRPSGAYPRRTPSRPPSGQLPTRRAPGSTERSPKNPPRPPSGELPRQAGYTESTEQNRSALPRSGSARAERAEHAPRAQLPAGSWGDQGKRPILPYAQETSEAHLERTERLRTLRQDFLDHAQTKVAPQKPRNVVLAVVLTIGMLVLCIVGTVVFFQLRSSASSISLFTSGGQSEATQFLDAMKGKDYSGAYADCAATVEEVNGTLNHPLSGQDFQTQASAADQSAGQITGYTLTGSQTLDANNEQYLFTVTRTQLTIPHIILGVTKGTDGSWKISSVDNNLLNPPAPSSSELDGGMSVFGQRLPAAFRQINRAGPFQV